MKRGTKEHYSIMDQFERDFPSMDFFVSAKVERIKDRTGWPENYFYTNGEVNNLFIAYMHGYALAKHMFDTQPQNG